MTFLLSKWLEKTVKGAITAVLAFLAAPTVSERLTGVGVTVDVPQASAGLWTLFVSLSNWLKHQKWTPTLVKKLL